MVLKSHADQFRKQMQRPDLIFVTKENEEQLKALAEGKAGSTCEHCNRTVLGPHDCQDPNVEEVT